MYTMADLQACLLFEIVGSCALKAPSLWYPVADSKFQYSRGAEERKNSSRPPLINRTCLGAAVHTINIHR